MADGVDFKLEGIEELLGKLESITHDLKFKGGRYALRKAANVIAASARDNAQKLNDNMTPEEIAKNIAVRWSGNKFKRSGDLMFRVGVLGGAKNYANTRDNVRSGRAGQNYTTGGSKANPGGDTWYWRFLEFGTSRVAPKPLMRDAANRNAEAAVSEFMSQYSKAIDRAIKRAQKKKAK